MLTRAEKIELGLILLATGIVAAIAVHLPVELELGSFLAVAALALLGQGFVRDLWLLTKQPKAGADAHREEVRCMCMESTVGLGGVLAGVLLTAFAVPVTIRMVDWAWPLAGGLIWGAGFFIKDVVIQWSPWKVRRVKDHGSILVRWR
ncbi:MAG TPA: hypothetical protein VK985_05570 [Rariglobus sp.]|nr:hypothetical protein [Rariglobus sp.]